ncbi:MAG: VWA domain-containing protein, partial [Bryobacteraceae bacterium]
LNKVKKRVAISSVVLSNQRVDLKNAIYNAVKKKTAEETANPLVWEGRKLIPSLARVFHRSQNLYIYLQAYEQGAPNTEPLIAFVSFYRGQRKVFQTKPVEITKRFPNTVKTMPIRFSIGLKRLAPGEYKCQVTVLNPVAQKAAFWRAEVEIVGSIAGPL